ncbi:SDR family oxidoreductase [Streptomyces umbrinus]|uniref:SDR family oxidoreductase n=1 Tax=Streptomyces umbrinus TaxID=67370 RepID=UPI003C2C1C6D
MVKAAALEPAPDRIRACSAHPRAVRTAMTGEFDHSFTAGQLLPRFGRPEEVARTVLFIVVDATFSTGAGFVLDCGVTAGPPTVLTPAP